MCAKSILTILTLSIGLAAVDCHGDAKESRDCIIVCPADGSRTLKLAASELRRYLYLRTGALLDIAPDAPGGSDAIELILAPEMGGQDYTFKTVGKDGERTLSIAGGTDLAVLYGVYHFLEKTGIRFNLHGDTIPDRKIELAIPDLDEGHSPIFEKRGLLPFHNFPEGPDWWQVDDYKAYFAQLTKMRMNFMGFHCYPNVPWGPEPSVWMGLPEDVNEDGTVKASYPASFHMTERLNGYGEASGSPKRWWGYSATRTSDFAAGAGEIFEVDNYGPEYMQGHLYRNLTPETSNAVFNRTGKMFSDAFTFAKKLGINLAIGTETPLHLPREVQDRLQSQGIDPGSPEAAARVYEGMMKRIMRAFPVDYYWAWTPEGWLSPRPQEEIDRVLLELELANKAIQKLNAPFGLATSGWVIGPALDPTLFDRKLDKNIPISCINTWLGASRVTRDFAAIEHRDKWAIPWAEDDTAMVSPNLWVGRLRRDAADARRYGCTGLMAIHWRTRVLAPNFAFLARAGWDRDLLPAGEAPVPARKRSVEGYIGGQVAAYDANAVNDTDEGEVYSTCRFALQKYRIKVPNGKYRLTLKFCEVAYQEENIRVFNVKVGERSVARDLDVFAKAGYMKPYDVVVEDVVVDDGRLDVVFEHVKEYPFIAGIVIEGKTDDLNQIEGTDYSRRINFGGQEWGDYEADLESLISQPVYEGPRDLSSEAFYREWCRGEFGEQVSDQIADIFISLDSGGPSNPTSFVTAQPRNMPLPSVWIDGPGGLKVDSRPWNEVRDEYEFVSKLESLRPAIRGRGNLKRFDYWLNTFRFFRAIGELTCVRGELDAVIAQVQQIDDVVTKKQLITDRVLPLRHKLARLWEEMISHQLAATDSPGEMGTIANLEQHSRRNLGFVNAHDSLIETILGESLPAKMKVANTYRGKARIIVPTERSILEKGEKLSLKIFILDQGKPKSASFYWRELGSGQFREIAIKHVARSVYKVDLPSQASDFEYYIEAISSDGDKLTWPITAPQMNKSVVMMR